jgi:transposase-like protein
MSAVAAIAATVRFTSAPMNVPSNRAKSVQTGAAEDVTAFRDFPTNHWQKIWSTNSLERLNAEIKRRTNVVGIFPNDAAALRLITAVCVETHDEWSA